jgi:hypothetical protein
LTDAWVPTAMNAGVWTSPCGVRITPARPSRPGSSASTLKNGADESLGREESGAVTP